MIVTNLFNNLCLNPTTTIRCLRCESCTQNTNSQRRRCLLLRTSDAAAAGSEGAWLAAHGAGAVGARVGVWWPLEESFFDGMVRGFVVPLVL
jgi:hypothetical protein